MKYKEETPLKQMRKLYNRDRFVEETQDALRWYEMNDIVAYADTDKTSVFIIIKDTHVLVSGSEVSYRADLYRCNYETI